MVGPGSRGLASLGPLPGCPCRFSGAGYHISLEARGQVAWHPLTPSWVPVCGAAAPQIMEVVEGMPVPQIMPVRGGRQLSLRTSTGAVLGQGC